MIVTCPGCEANYRVRNEAVPDDGARMRCPTCGTMFLALAPAGRRKARETPAAVEVPEPVSQLVSALDAQRARAQPPQVPPPNHPAGHALAGNGGGAPPSGPRHSASTSLDQLVGMMQSPPPTNPPVAGAAPQTLGPDPFDAPPSTPGMGIGDNQLSSRALPDGDLFPDAWPRSPAGDDPFAVTEDGGDPFGREGHAAPVAPSLTIDDDPVEVHVLPLTGPAVDVGAHSASRPSTGLGLPQPGIHREEQKAPRAPILPGLIGGGAVLLGSVVCVAGLAFAGWTVGALKLDPVLMPLAEKHLDAHPPRSSLGRDDPKPDLIRAAAVQAKERGDLVAEAVAWRRLLAVQPDPEAQKRLQDLIDELHHPGVLD